MRRHRELRGFATCVLAAACGLVLVSAPQAVAAEEDWGTAADGLRSRMVSDRKVYEAGQGVYLWLDVWNMSTKPVEVARGEWMKRAVELIGPDGQRVKGIERRSTSRPWKSKMLPGKIANVLTISGKVSFGVLPAGRYRVRWAAGKLAPEVAGRVQPPSNTVTFEVRPVTNPPAARPERKTPVPFGPEKNGLCTRLSAKADTFRAGEPIAVKLEITNVGNGPRSYHVPQVHYNGRVTVIDERGMFVPYLGGSFQTNNPLKVLPKGKTHDLAAFDLAKWYYLRRPGRYSILYPGTQGWGGGDSPIPLSNVFSFRVLPNPQADADGDPVGRLLPLMKNGWKLSATRPWTPLVQPTGEWGRATGRMMSFYQWHGGKPDGMSVVYIWLTKTQAPREPWQSEQPGSAEYVGKLPTGHLYLLSRFKRENAWPTFKEDIKRALMKTP